MKLALIIIALITLASCGSSQQHCDAYGSVDNEQVETV